MTFPVGGNSHKRVHFGSCPGRDFSITVPPTLTKFIVLETVIRELHFLLCNALDIFFIDPENEGSSASRYVVIIIIIIIIIFY